MNYFQDCVKSKSVFGVTQSYISRWALSLITKINDLKCWAWYQNLQYQTEEGRVRYYVRRCQIKIFLFYTQYPNFLEVSLLRNIQNSAKHVFKNNFGVGLVL
jgi:hypothetical protein